MGLLKEIGIAIGVVFVIVVVLNLVRPIVSPTGKVAEVPIKETVTTSTNPPLPTTSILTTTIVTPTLENIFMFMCEKEGDLIRFYFSFNDKKAYDGEVFLTVLDNANKTVYSNRFSVKASQYLDYVYKITGQPIGKAYEWKVPFNSIQKGFSKTGTAHITFTTINGKTLTADTVLLEIPSYTPEEIKQLYENQYLQFAKSIGQTIAKGDFEITLVKVGYFTHLNYDTSGDEITDFRADVKVKNIGAQSETFGSYDAAMVVGSSQYSRSYRSVFNGDNIYPGVIKEGYILYENVPKNLSGRVKIIVGSAYWHSIDYLSSENILYTFDIEL